MRTASRILLIMALGLLVASVLSVPWLYGPYGGALFLVLGGPLLGAVLLAMAWRLHRRGEPDGQTTPRRAVALGAALVLAGSAVVHLDIAVVSSVILGGLALVSAGLAFIPARAVRDR